MKNNRKAPENGEGVVLSVRHAGEGGRSVRLFTRTEGKLSFFASRSTLRRCGAGLLAPFTPLRYSAAPSDYGGILTQYEGRAFFDMTALSYEELAQWYYAVEIAEQFFPEGQPDGTAYALLLAGAAQGAARNRTVTAFILSVQLLAAAGSDPAEEEPMTALRLSPEEQALLGAFRQWRWEGDFPLRIGRGAFLETARYLDRFIERYGGVAMKTRGAFLALPAGTGTPSQ